MKISSHFLLHIQSNFGWDHWKTDFLYSSKESITFYILSHTKNLPAIWETGVRPLGQREIPWRREWQPTPVFLPGESHRQRSLAGYSSWGQQRVRHDWMTNFLHWRRVCLTLRVSVPCPNRVQNKAHPHYIGCSSSHELSKSVQDQSREKAMHRAHSDQLMG